MAMHSVNWVIFHTRMQSGDVSEYKQLAAVPLALDFLFSFDAKVMVVTGDFALVLPNTFPGCAASK